MKKLKQTIGFFIEVNSFILGGFLVVLGGFLVGIRINYGYLLIVLGFIMAYIVGRQIERDAKNG